MIVCGKTQSTNNHGRKKGRADGAIYPLRLKLNSIFFYTKRVS